jgi:hypothetical protein
MNPTAPFLHTTIELHKQNTPIRQVVNWKNSPAYNIKNSVKLINDPNNIPFDVNTRICSFDIRDMYTNIPQ